MQQVSIDKLIEQQAVHCRKLTNSNIRGYDIDSLVGASSTKAKDIIENHVWGTHGIKGNKPVKYVKLVNCSSTHLKNILRTQPQILALTTLVITAILLERNNLELCNYVSSD